MAPWVLQLAPAMLARDRLASSVVIEVATALAKAGSVVMRMAWEASSCSAWASRSRAT